MVSKIEPYLDKRWALAEDRQKQRLHIWFIYEEKVQSLSVPVFNWFVWFEVIT